MKKEYLTPNVLKVKIETYSSLLEVSDGALEDYEGKQHDDVVDDNDETSMLDQKSNSLFTNDYIKKVWD